MQPPDNPAVEKWQVDCYSFAFCHLHDDLCDSCYDPDPSPEYIDCCIPAALLLGHACLDQHGLDRGRERQLLVHAPGQRRHCAAAIIATSTRSTSPDAAAAIIATTTNANANADASVVGSCHPCFCAARYCAPRSPIGLITTAAIRLRRLAPRRIFHCNDETDQPGMARWVDVQRLCS
mmetsp:Transcript_13180/g.21476  ORF Transcript_13180/g.21476 Transcript_13180/m.21476 type:complete len:178 (-) Transcript_13180:116-649(-)